MFKTRNRVVIAATIGAALLLATPGIALAQEPEQISFERPESWALKYFTSITLLSGLETPTTRAPWSIDVGVELGWVPQLTPSQRYIGFDGTKQEDLNKTSVFFRPRVTIGLPHRLSMIVGFVPPLRVFGLEPKLLAVGLERPVYEGETWLFGARGYGQIGTINGAYTCPSSVLPFAPGSAGNLYGCQATSSDTASLRFLGGEVSASYRPRHARLSPHAAFSVNYMNVAFQVDALRFGLVDTTDLGSHGVTVAGSAGVSYTINKRFQTTFDVFYSPLEIQRPFQATTNSGLFNVRALVAYRLR